MALGEKWRSTRPAIRLWPEPGRLLPWAASETKAFPRRKDTSFQRHGLMAVHWGGFEEVGSLCPV